MWVMPPTGNNKKEAMSLSEENMRAVAPEAHNTLSWFLSRAANPNFTWAEVDGAEDPGLIEELKQHAVLVASVLEQRLQELYAGALEDHA